MTLLALASGALWDSPERRQSKNGKDFVAATLKATDGADVTWIKVLAFGTEAQDTLMQLRGGEALSVSGPLKFDLYKPPDREARISLTIFADAILPLRAEPKPKKSKEQKPGAPFDDGLPEGGQWS